MELTLFGALYLELYCRSENIITLELMTDIKVKFVDCGSISFQNMILRND